jgi:hypothetical protein
MGASMQERYGKANNVVYAVTQNNMMHTTVLFSTKEAADEYRQATLENFPAFAPSEIEVTAMTVYQTLT